MPLGNPAVLPIQPFTPYGLDYEQMAANYVANDICPFFQTPKTSGWYYVPDARNFLRAEDLAWSRENGATRVISQYGKDTFIAQPYGGEEPVSDIDAGDWGGGKDDLITQTMRQMMARINLAREVRTFGLIDGSGAGTTSVTGTGQWDSTAANPRLDVMKSKTAVAKRVGREANTLIISGLVYEVITGTQSSGSAGAAVLDTLKYTSRDSITEEMLARYFILEKVRFAKAVQQDTTKHSNRTVNPGLPEAGTYVWSGKKFYTAYIGTPGAKEPNAATTFGTDIATPDDYYEYKTKSTIVRIVSVVQEKVVCLPSINIGTTVIS